MVSTQRRSRFEKWMAISRLGIGLCAMALPLAYSEAQPIGEKPDMTRKKGNDESLPRGIEHIGITVPDIDQAITFFRDAFGAEPLYSAVTASDPPSPWQKLRPQNDLAVGTAIVRLTMLRMRNGPNVELFQIDRPRGRPDENISDFGIHHFSITVEDVLLATQRFQEAGGTLLEGPYPLFGKEKGPGNFGRFGRTPWGLLIEFESLPSPMKYDGNPKKKRWIPPREEES